MKKRKYASGGMPPMSESMKSGNRVSKQVGAETKKMMPGAKRTMPSIGESMKSGNRMSKENAKDMKAVSKYAKGGKVKKRYNDGGDIVMGDAADDISGLSLGLPKADLDLKRAMTDKELMDANLAAVRAREAASTAKPKAKPRAASAPAKKAAAPVAEAPVRKAAAAPSKPATAKTVRVGAESWKGTKDKVRSAARGSGEAIKSAARGVKNLPSRAAGALESANDQTKMQARNMAALRAKNPDLVTQLMEASNPYKKAKGGKVAAKKKRYF